MLKPTSTILRQKGLSQPTVVLDRNRALANIQRMADKARLADAVFRPHFKTHQSAVVGRWFADAGVRHITVSSLPMAEQFAGHGWRDITVALLFNPLEMARAGRLAQHLNQHGGRLGLLVDDPAVAENLATNLDAPADVWLKIDTGYGRTGVRWDDADKLRAIIAACRGLARPAGLLTHSGHSYAARGTATISRIYDETVARLEAARENCRRSGLFLSLGDTPCCSVIDDLSACDEIRPGNFVFYDLMQLEIGSCAATDLAAATACPVLGVYPERRQIIVHGGAVHLSKEYLLAPDGRAYYGCLGTATADGLGTVLAQAPLVSLSQEHGAVEIAYDFDAVAGRLQAGDLVLVWPVHSCLNCDLLRDQLAQPVTF